MTAQSAGGKPAGSALPPALAGIRDAGLSTEGLISNTRGNLPEKPDAAIIPCADTAGGACPQYLGTIACGHRGMPDPVGMPGQAKGQGYDPAIGGAFTGAMAALRKRASAPARRLEAEAGAGAARLHAAPGGIAAT
jgi:arsenate reductase